MYVYVHIYVYGVIMREGDGQAFIHLSIYPYIHSTSTASTGSALTLKAKYVTPTLVITYILGIYTHPCYNAKPRPSRSTEIDIDHLRLPFIRPSIATFLVPGIRRGVAM